MDARAVVAWRDRIDAKTALSVLQHAMNVKLGDEEAFVAECQRESVMEECEDEWRTVAL